MTLLGGNGRARCSARVIASRSAAQRSWLAREIVDSIQDDVSLLYITPDVYRETSIELLQRAEERDWWIVYDLSFALTSAPFHPAQNEKLASRVVTIDSLSEQLAGWRLGWMAGSEMALRLRAGKQAITICTTAVSQWAGLGTPSPVGGETLPRTARIHDDLEWTAIPNIPEEVRAVAADGTQLRYALMEMAREMDDIIALGRGDPDLRYAAAHRRGRQSRHPRRTHGSRRRSRAWTPARRHR